MVKVIDGSNFCTELSKQVKCYSSELKVLILLFRKAGFDSIRDAMKAIHFAVSLRLQEQSGMKNKHRIKLLEFINALKYLDLTLTHSWFKLSVK